MTVDVREVPAGVAGVESDGRTVWVHLDGFTVGRFSSFGIDLHTADASGCIDCTHEKPMIRDWFRFQSGVLRHYGIVVTDDHKPTFLELP
jgi:hypothetical protein